MTVPLVRRTVVRTLNRVPVRTPQWLLLGLIPTRRHLRQHSSLVAPNTSAGSIRDVNPTGSGTNCVNCVVATDATLAGRPASALPSGAQPISTLQDVFGGTFKPVAGQAE